MLCGNRQINYHLTGHHKSLCVYVFLKETICPSPIFLFISQKFSYFPGSKGTLLIIT